MSISQQLQELTGQAVCQLAPLPGGCVARVYRATLSDGQCIVAKSGAAGSRFDLEGQMLACLGNHGLPVPTVHHASDTLLVMDHLASGDALGPAAQYHAADLIAGLHAITAPTFGFNYDTVIGGLHQPNPETTSWIDFFRDHRLMLMAKNAHKENQLPLNTLQRIARFADNLQAFLLEPEAPSLIHGDLWSGNILCKDNRITGLIDPAIYYAHAEIELAFGTLFSTLTDTFFDRYREQRTIEPGFFEERLDIYNLYPLLVHVRLFGSNYVTQIERTLGHFGY